ARLLFVGISRRRRLGHFQRGTGRCRLRVRGAGELHNGRRFLVVLLLVLSDHDRFLVVLSSHDRFLVAILVVLSDARFLISLLVIAGGGRFLVVLGDNCARRTRSAALFLLGLGDIDLGKELLRAIAHIPNAVRPVQLVRLVGAFLRGFEVAVLH